MHSEPNVFIPAQALAAWFDQRNSSGTFIGNKLSMRRLNGTAIKPLGWPSWIDASVNENCDEKYTNQLDEMEVGYLRTISDTSIQDCCLSRVTGINAPGLGIPLSMLMIAKFVDYTCSMRVADLMTTRVLVLCNAETYEQIQTIVSTTLKRFAATDNRLVDVRLSFPSFDQAKQGRTAIVAASAWHAYYVDDLQRVEVSGGLTAQ